MSISTRARIPAQPGARRLAALRRNAIGYLFLLPALLAFATFSWYPIVRGFIISFQKYDLVKGAEWVGWSNFEFVLNDPLVPVAWRNTLQFTLLGLLVGYLLPVILAILVNEMKRGKSYFRLAYYLPVILPPMVSVLLWKWFYDMDTGLFNAILQAIGLPAQRWLFDRNLVMLCLVVLSTWANAGGTMLLYLAALQGVPSHLYEAAEIDGAGLWRRLWHITLPQIRGVMLILLVLQIIGTMQLFTEPFVMTDGGPANATLSVVMLLYRYGFRFYNFGAAAALGLILFFVLVAFSILYLWLTRRISQSQ